MKRFWYLIASLKVWLGPSCLHSADVWPVAATTRLECETQFGAVVIKCDEQGRACGILIKGEGYEYAVPKEETDNLERINLQSVRIVLSRRPAEGETGWIRDGNLVVCGETEGTMKADSKGEVAAESRHVRFFYIFSPEGYEYRERLLPLRGSAKWSIEIKDPGEKAELNGESTDPLPYSPTSLLIKN